MAEIKLNVMRAGSKSEIEKTYTANGYDLMMGTLEDFLGIIDIDKLDDTSAVFKMVLEGYDLFKPLIMDIFDDLTDEEWRRIRLTDLVSCVMDIGQNVIESLGILGSGNGRRA